MLPPVAGSGLLSLSVYYAILNSSVFLSVEAKLTKSQAGGRELFLLVEEGGDGFLFLLENAPDIGRDTGILRRPNDPQGHASRFF
jgi:hypothetical protein